ncbi:peroxiredoxin [Streptomyces rubellomurinus subsp. indigoferus]|uniref:Peroxiredoxin n=1 Tax=Streptomyces rubellomurinus (strain ATCC 31215) TaxID=359131 RepID=A0A0F2T7S5_STRR3|nr:OsmC family protein [Streptomyces rubellomurinus]KJS56712.1 peroxiredoxin [Streptomyces rubellomurinus subsp. indigoferus]KJS58441.1 peroxiredoxin [Streptomyces rubellomurinus]
MTRQHTYTVEITWTGNQGTGTGDYRSYARDHEVSAPGLPTIPGSSDPAFRGDPARWNPEQLLLASISQCHLLWYLHLCAVNGVVVTSYSDQPVGRMAETADGGHFTSAVLHPRVEVAEEAMVDKAVALHADAHRSCFIANSVNFPVRHEPVVTVAAGN